MSTKTVYINIGNSDHKLSQRDWSLLWQQVDAEIRFSSRDMGGPVIFGAWISSPVSPFQNACWCVELTVPLELRLRRTLALAARDWDQDSIAWTEVSAVDFIKPHQ
jgi:hypothetical protein